MGKIKEGEIMKWLKNLEALTEGKIGNCPYCGSENMDCGFTIVDGKKKMGYGAIWCNDCQQGYHISRIVVNETMKLNSVPENIVLE